jgi:hypothetical protein
MVRLMKCRPSAAVEQPSGQEEAADLQRVAPPAGQPERVLPKLPAEAEQGQLLGTETATHSILETPYYSAARELVG